VRGTRRRFWKRGVQWLFNGRVLLLGCSSEQKVVVTMIVKVLRLVVMMAEGICAQKQSSSRDGSIIGEKACVMSETMQTTPTVWMVSQVVIVNCVVSQTEGGERKGKERARRGIRRGRVLRSLVMQ